jgi:scyllo-inositol 2-dehydrogenase (NADP+)
MNTQIKVGLLAYGMSGKVFHAPFVSTHPGFTLHAVLERNKKQAVADYPGTISYNTIDDLLADENIDLVIVNTPNYTHYEYAKQALNAGKHILVEKPFTASSAQAKEIFGLAKKVGKKALVYQNRRYDSGFNAVKNIIESKVLGHLVEVHFRFDRYRNEIGPKLFKEEPYEASGLLYDLGPHLLDQAICLFGKPDKFYKVLSKNRIRTKVDDFFSIQLTYKDGLNVFLIASMLVAESKDAFILNGMNGSFSKPHADVQEMQLLQGIKPTDVNYGLEETKDAGKLTTITLNGEKQTTAIAPKKGDYTALFEAVYQSIVNNVNFPITEEEILTQLEILES